MTPQKVAQVRVRTSKLAAPDRVAPSGTLTVEQAMEQLLSTRVSLRTAHAPIVTIEMTFMETLLNLVSDPNIAYVLVILGIYGLIFEFYNPGLIIPGIVGVVSLILAFYALHTLPVNYAGLALIIFAIILFVLEIKVASHGMLTVGGIVALLLGSLMLIRTEPSFNAVTLSWKVIVLAVVVTAAFFTTIIGLGVRAQRRKPTTGIQGLLGEIGETLTALDPDGRIRIHGESWSARSIEGYIARGLKVQPEEIENLTLKVRKATS